MSLCGYRFLKIMMLAALLMSAAAPVIAAEQQESVNPHYRATEFPLPRFVSLKSNDVYVRAGPGKQYPILWRFQKEGLPVEITLEYGNWRRIRDIEGQEGWVFHALLSGNRTAIIQAKNGADLKRSAKESAKIIAHLEKGVLVSVKSCAGLYCELEVSGYRGWAERKMLWGVYENEDFD